MTQPALPVGEILRVAQSHGARTVRVFGSRARGDATAESDLDLLISLEPGRSLLDVVAIKQDLEDLLGFPVDGLRRAVSRHTCGIVSSRRLSRSRHEGSLPDRLLAARPSGSAFGEGIHRVWS
jgi:predicted nucleotidyltransferase